MRNLKHIGLFALGVLVAISACVYMFPINEVKALSPVPRFLFILDDTLPEGGRFVRFEVNDFTPDSVAEVILQRNTVVEIFVQDPNAPFGSEGLENPDDPVLVRLTEHRVVTHGIRGPGGGFSHLAQFQGTTPFIRRLPDTTPIFEYFVGEIVQ